MNIVWAYHTADVPESGEFAPHTPQDPQRRGGIEYTFIPDTNGGGGDGGGSGGGGGGGRVGGGDGGRGGGDGGVVGFGEVVNSVVSVVGFVVVPTWCKDSSGKYIF